MPPLPPTPPCRCGDELAAHLLNMAAPAAGLAAAGAQQLVVAVREREAKDVRDVLRELVLQRASALAGAAGGTRRG